MIKQTSKTTTKYSSLAINIKLEYCHHCYYVRHIMMNSVI